MIRPDAEICVRANHNLLSMAQSKWQFGVQNDFVIGEKFISQTIVKGKSIEVIPRSQNQIMELRQEITQAGFAIEAAEIERVVFLRRSH